MNVCKNCGNEYEGNFCPVCGLRYGPVKRCPNCGAYVSGKYCSECGKKYEVDPVVEASLSDESLSDLTLSDVSLGTSEAKDRIAKYCSEIVFRTAADGYAVSGTEAPDVTDIVVPAVYNGMPVTAIGEDAFRGNSSLAFISIPEFARRIEKSAFRDCASLGSIFIPDSVTKIGPYAFSGCGRLACVTIPDGVTSIGASAFRNCMSLEYVRIPSSVTQIGAYAFSGCTSLTALYYSGTRDAWSKIVDDGGSDSMPFTTVYFYSEKMPFQKGDFWHYADGKPAVWGNEEQLSVYIKGGNKQR